MLSPRRRAAVLAVQAAFALLPSVVLAQGVRLDQFRPPASLEDGFSLSRPLTPGPGRWNAGLYVDYARDSLVYETRTGNTVTEKSAVVQDALNLELTAAVGLGERAALFAGVEGTPLMQGDANPLGASADGARLGDPWVGGRYRLVGDRDAPFGLALQVAATLPLARGADSQQAYVGERSVTFLPALLAEVAIGKLHIVANAGTHLRVKRSAFSSGDVGQEGTLGLGALLPLAHDDLTLHAEIFGSTDFNHFFKRFNTPLLALLGIKWRVVDPLLLGFSGGPGLTAGYGAPQYQLIALLGYSPARREPPPPPPPAPPPPSDRDHDGLLDAVDRCPDEPEDRDGFEDDDGCPDPDNDKDGIADAADQCPNEPEDTDGFQDEDGCPDPDNDGDGIADVDDKCTEQPEDKDGFEDEDGCPDPDNDGDGVLDADDACPMVPGKAETKGCPKTVRVESGQIVILQRVEFATNRAKVLPASEPVLDEVRAVIAANSKLRKLRIEGHTDDRGSDKHNMELSRQRARSVARWLVDHGIDAERLEAYGCGETRPRESNATAAGRQTNRRVEVHIIDPAPPGEPHSTEGCKEIEIRRYTMTSRSVAIDSPGRSTQAARRQARPRPAATTSVLAILAALAAAGCSSGKPAAPPPPVAVQASALVSSVTDVYETGVDAAHQQLASSTAGTTVNDPHYTVVATNDPNRTGSVPRAAVVTGVGGGWASPGYSRWISLDYAECNTSIGGVPICGNHYYDYSTTFTIPSGADLTTASLVTLLTFDDDLAIYLNGTQVISATAAATGSPWAYFHYFSIGPANANFAIGTNTLTYRITNSGGGITGIDVNRVSVKYGSCSQDSECGPDRYCDTANSRCTPKLANGAGLPTVAGHSPTLNGSCSSAVALAVCMSGLCSTLTSACVACNSDSGSGLPPRCNAAEPICFDYSSAARSQRPQDTCGCLSDSDCASTDWCSSGSCTPKLANGTAMPAQSGHSPTLDGSCSSNSSSAAVAVCSSGVCDTTSNQCGIDLGDGSCSSDAQCTSGLCIASGANAGKCEPCRDDAQCGGSTPACNTTSNQCVECTASNAARCSGTTPLCDTTASACAGCNGNDGSGATLPCSGSAPYCADDGSCSTQCQRDSDCGTGNWCNAGSCSAKLANGTALPTVAGHSPALDGTCSSNSSPAALAVCSSGVCDTASNQCGIDLGNGTCGADADCTAGVCVLSGANTGKCEPCNGDAQCGGANPACDTAANQCVQCTTGNAGQCTGMLPLCDGGAHQCAGCNGNDGSLATLPCPGSAPYCAGDGSCSTQCQRDSDCGVGNWCDAGSCTAQLANGAALPVSVNHTPALDGSTCSTAVAMAVCQSGACDAASHRCGVDAGHGTCTADAQCTSGLCIATGTNAGKCEPCRDDAQCAGATPVCDTAANQCVACGAQNTSQCAGTTPVCDTSSHACVGCNGDQGVQASAACPSALSPFCASDGSCGSCSDNASCSGATHAGPICNTVSGACGTACNVDADCPGQWCDNPTASIGAGTCRAKLANGQPIPVAAPLNATCNPTNAARVCMSGTCDAADALCGLPNGRTCSAAAECRSAVCNANLQCGDPNGSDCSTAATCRSGICDPDGKCGAQNGEPCTTPAACRSDVCVAADGLCGALNGAPCSGEGDCRSGVCFSDGFCGKPVGESCTATEICRGVQCVSGNCADTCQNDAQCAAGSYCDDAGACVPALSNAEPCARATQCSSLTCNADGRCGDPDGTACSVAATCRGGACASSVCGTACSTDSECASGSYCDSGACVPALANGNTCTRATQCASGLCPGDGMCGLADGAACGLASECRSAICGASGACGTSCGSDAECTTGHYCDGGQCQPSAANGAMPGGAACDRGAQCISGVCSSDGACGAANGAPCGSAGVCRSDVCDGQDSSCGYVNGDGPCTGSNAAEVCRSQVCDQGACGYQNTHGPCSSGEQCLSAKCDSTLQQCVECRQDAECASGFFCEADTGICAQRRVNGMPCARDAQCVVDVCDADQHCGLNDGESCAKPNQCRSGFCGQGSCGMNAADAGAPDAGGGDAGKPDAGMPGGADAGTPDASTPDAGPADAATPAGRDAGKSSGKPKVSGQLAGGGGHFGCSALPGAPPRGAGVWLGLLAFGAAWSLRRRRRRN